MNDINEKIFALNPQTDAECEEAVALILAEIQRMNEEMRQEDTESARVQGVANTENEQIVRQTILRDAVSRPKPFRENLRVFWNEKLQGGVSCLECVETRMAREQWRTSSRTHRFHSQQ